MVFILNEQVILGTSVICLLTLCFKKDWNINLMGDIPPWVDMRVSDIMERRNNNKELELRWYKEREEKKEELMRINEEKKEKVKEKRREKARLKRLEKKELNAKDA